MISINDFLVNIYVLYYVNIKIVFLMKRIWFFIYNFLIVKCKNLVLNFLFLEGLYV